MLHPNLTPQNLNSASSSSSETSTPNGIFPNKKLASCKEGKGKRETNDKIALAFAAPAPPRRDPEPEIPLFINAELLDAAFLAPCRARAGYGYVFDGLSLLAFVWDDEVIWSDVLHLDPAGRGCWFCRDGRTEGAGRKRCEGCEGCEGEGRGRKGGVIKPMRWR